MSEEQKKTASSKTAAAKSPQAKTSPSSASKKPSSTGRTTSEAAPKTTTKAATKTTAKTTVKTAVKAPAETASKTAVKSSSNKAVNETKKAPKDSGSKLADNVSKALRKSFEQEMVQPSLDFGNDVGDKSGKTPLKKAVMPDALAGKPSGKPVEKAVEKVDGTQVERIARAEEKKIGKTLEKITKEAVLTNSDEISKDYEQTRVIAYGNEDNEEAPRRGNFAVFTAVAILLILLFGLLGILDKLKNKPQAIEKTPVANVKDTSSESAPQTEVSRAEEPVIKSVAETQNSVTVKVYNGWTISDIDNALSSRKLASPGAFMQAVSAVVKEKNLPFAEGLFLAGEYSLEKGENTAYELASEMCANLMLEASKYFEKIGESEYSISEYAIIASMISAETKNTEEYGYISSVIHNRLKDGIALGIDATTRYETGNWTDPLSQELLDTLTPYNTRRKKGLTPTGICCPDAKTLEAAINPYDTDYYYYRHSKDGVLHLNETYEQHLISQKTEP